MRSSSDAPYDCLYSSTQGGFLWGDRPSRLLHEYSPSPGELIALDLGCGDGVNSLWLESQGFDVVGIDISSLAISCLMSRFAKSNMVPSGRYFVADYSYAKNVGQIGLMVSCGLYQCLPVTSRLETHQSIMNQVEGTVLFSSLTNEIPLPKDHGTPDFCLPSLNEIEGLFSDWSVSVFRTGTIEDQHPPLVGAHRHSLAWVVAKRT